MRRISVPLYAPILVMVIIVALVNVGGVALSLGSDNRPRNAPTPVLVATQFIPAGTPVEHAQHMMTPTTIPTAQARQKRSIGAVLRVAEPPPAPTRALRLSGLVTSMNIYPGQQFRQQTCGSACTVLR